MRSSYDFLTVVQYSRRMTYGGDSRSPDDWDLPSDWFDNGKVADFMTVDAGSGILLMVPRTSKS